jgi:mRNA-degrading endonuclease RelE of RelBE toxin-antitoxin system
MSNARKQPDRQIVQMPRFARTKKKLPAKVQLEVDQAIEEISKDPFRGEPKSGALSGMRIYKFKVGPQQLLLAYRFDAKTNTIEAWAVGPHENFYRDLQNYREAK